MEPEINANKLLKAAQKNNLSLKRVYSFQLKDRKVEVVFSNSVNAQTVENALVKIATRRIS